MTAPLGTWNFFTSGSTTLQGLILASNSSGGITGTLGGESITGVWDETSQILSFSRATAGGTDANDDGFTIEVYTGTLFPGYSTPNGLVAGEGVPLLLAGNFGNATAGAAVGPFNQSGWFATNVIKFKEKEGKEGKDSKDVLKDGKEHKDHKDGKEHGKEKELFKEALAEKVPEIQSLGASSESDSVAATQMVDGNGSEVRVAAGKSFILGEERPQVGGAALQS